MPVPAKFTIKAILATIDLANNFTGEKSVEHKVTVLPMSNRSLLIADILIGAAPSSGWMNAGQTGAINLIQNTGKL